MILRSDPSHRHTCKPIPYSIFDATHRPINPEEPKTAALATKEVKVATKLEEPTPPIMMVSKEATKRPQGRPRKHPLPSFGKVQEEVLQEVPRQPPKRCLKRGKSLGKSKSMHEWDAEVYKTREQLAKSRFEEISHALNNAKERETLKSSVSLVLTKPI